MASLASVVVLAYGTEEWLDECVTSCLASIGVDIEIIVVDNGASEAALAQIRGRPRVQVIASGRNRGFAGGVNFGVRHAKGDVVVLLNSDARVAPDAISLLATEARKPHAGVVGALILLADQPTTINSAGNPLHILGLSWAGNMGLPADELPAVVNDVASASGACLALSRELWDELGGFWDDYFAYLEDMELSWRTRQLGLPVRVVSAARVWHHYEFSRTPIKAYLLERNRLIFLLTCHETRTLLTLAIPLIALEFAMVALAIGQGWGAQKVRGWGWILRHPRRLRRRRAFIQAQRVVSDAELTSYFVATFAAQQVEMPAAGRVLQTVLEAYWSVARRAIGRTRRPRSTPSRPVAS